MRVLEILRSIVKCLASNSLSTSPPPVGPLPFISGVKMANEQDAKQSLSVVWSPDHKIIFANSFGIRMGDADVMVDLGTLQTLNDKTLILSSHQLAMTVRGAKLLGAMLSEAIKQLEAKIGEIPLGPQSEEIF